MGWRLSKSGEGLGQLWWDTENCYGALRFQERLQTPSSVTFSSCAQQHKGRNRRRKNVWIDPRSAKGQVGLEDKGLVASRMYREMGKRFIESLAIRPSSIGLEAMDRNLAGRHGMESRAHGARDQVLGFNISKMVLFQGVVWLLEEYISDLSGRVSHINKTLLYMNFSPQRERVLDFNDLVL